MPNAVHDLACKVCAEHLNSHRMLEARPATVLRLLEKLGAFRDPGLLPDFIAACEADYRGRKGLEQRSYPQGEYLQRCHQAAAAIFARDLDLKGVSGPLIGQRVSAARIDAIKRVIKP